MELQDQLEIGKQAEDFLKYIHEHPYFEGLLDRIKLEYARRILELHPLDDSFKTIKSSMDAMNEVMNAIRGDIYLGSEAFNKLNGTTEEPKGLL
jgi:hypothetical protein